MKNSHSPSPTIDDVAPDSDLLPAICAKQRAIDLLSEELDEKKGEIKSIKKSISDATDELHALISEAAAGQPTLFSGKGDGQ